MSINYVVLDLETLPNVVNVWNLFKPYVPYENVIKERSIICGGYSYLYPKEQSYSTAKVVSIGDNPLKL